MKRFLVFAAASALVAVGAPTKAQTVQDYTDWLKEFDLHSTVCISSIQRGEAPDCAAYDVFMAGGRPGALVLAAVAAEHGADVLAFNETTITNRIAEAATLRAQ